MGSLTSAGDTRLGHDIATLPVRRADGARDARAGGAAPLPAALRAGIKRLSGISVDDAAVHYDSPQPATVGALAHTQGAHIHVASAQEAHLEHEAWHVVQQKQGRVRATVEVNGRGVNDEARLEHEAETMGATLKAMRSTRHGEARARAPAAAASLHQPG